jgi:hypothetical protein
MKKEALAFTLVGLMLLGTGFCLGKLDGPKVQNVFPPKYHTEDMPPVKGKHEKITLVFSDSVDSRPTYCVEFPDSTVIDAMYPEEIANSLNRGVWEYNEMLTIKEEQ